MSSPVIFMGGVSGSGKTTIAQQVAKVKELSFYDADDFHSEANRKKMSEGVPLTDEDRIPWLQSLNRLVQQESANGLVIACSALKQAYRDILTKDITTPVYWVWLYGKPAVIANRLQLRSAHFMPPVLLGSQLQIAETPFTAIHVNIDQSIQEITATVVRYIAAQQALAKL